MRKELTSFEDLDNELFGDGQPAPEETEEATETPEEAEGEATEETGEDEPAEAKETETPEAKAEGETEQPDQSQEPTANPDGMMPYGAYKSEKEKRQEWQKKFEDFEKKFQATQQELERLQQAEAQRRQQASQQKAPDPIEDPEGFRQHMSQQLETTQLKTKFQMSKRFAVSEHGAETVQAAEAALRQSGDDALANKFIRSDDPVGELVAWHKKQSVLSKLGDDPDAYIEQQVQARLAALQNPQTQTQQADPAPGGKLPPNLGKVPSTGPAPKTQTYDDIDEELWG